MGRRSGNVTPPHAEGSDGADDAQSGKLRNFMSRFRGGKSKSKSNRKPETALKTESASSDDNPSPAFVGDFPDFDELGLEPRKLDELAKHALSGNASFVANIVSQDSSGPADSDSGNEKSVIDSVTENDGMLISNHSLCCRISITFLALCSSTRAKKIVVITC
eukprot:m.182096 g.182096  ORF g.182096 m.182096 type:complete len:163 (+) comp18454_c0_seq1:242-730(+)